MTYRQEMNRLATTVGELLTEGGAVPGDDLRAAVAGHAALLSLLRQLDRDLGIERAEVIELGRLLHRQPWVIDQALTDVLLAPAASRAGQLWRDVARAATIAQHDWQNSTPASRPTNSTAWAWSEAADIASLAEAVGILNGDIADSLTAAARWRDAADYRIGQTQLLAAARDVRALAATGALPRAPDLNPLAADRVLVNVAPDNLPDALNRLSRIVATSADISPEHVELISAVVADTALTAAAALGRARNAAGTDTLREHATRLSAVAGQSRRLIPLQPGDGRALAQAQQIHYLLTNLRRRGVLLLPADAREVAHAIPDVTRELARTAGTQLESRRWLIRRSEPQGPTWTPIRAEEEAPGMLARLRDAASHSHTLDRNASETWRVNRTRTPTPRDLLAKPLAGLTPASPLDRAKIAPRPPRRG